MKIFLYIAVCCLLCAGCVTSESSRNMGADEAKNTYEDAHSTLRSGVSTFESMKAKYGEPHDRVETENGFACRWLDRRTVTKTVGVAPGGLASFDEGSTAGRYRHTITYLSELEAFFSKDGKLLNFQVKSDML